MRSVLFRAVLISIVTFGSLLTPALAQGIDCAKARSAQEKAICASPRLMALDHQVAIAYADAVARTPGPEMRQGLIAWLRQRDAACKEAAGMEACLARQLTERLAALQPAAPAPVAQVAHAEQTVQPQPAAAPLPDPVIPSGANPPAAAGQLDAASLPAAEQAETLLHVTSPGRFAVTAHSQGGASLQLVDMLTGPSDEAGVAGSQDGRVDQLLDVGTYKLRVSSAKGTTGNVTLALTAFHDAAPPAALPQPGRVVSAALADGEQRAYWLVVPDAVGGAVNVRIEAAGRALGDLRLWRNGRELVDMVPDQERIEPKSGHPLTDLRLVGHVEPGTYLVIAYGGPSLPWTDNDTAQPFLLRAGASPALAEGWTGGAVGPFGSEVFAWPAVRGRLRLDLPAPAVASLIVGDAVSVIDRKSRSPSAEIGIPTKGDGVAELRAAAGQAYTLRMIASTASNQVTQAGTYFLTAATSGLGGDEPPPAVLLERYDVPGAVPKPPAIIASTLPKLGDGWHAKFNLHGETSLLFQSETGGEVAVHSSGIEVTTLRDTGGVANLPPGYFDLVIRPKPGVEGIVDLIVAKPGQTPALQAPLPADPVLPLGIQTVTRGQRLVLTGNRGPGIAVGLVARPVPVALVEGPLAVTLAAGAGLSVPVQVAPGGRLAAAEVGVGDIAVGRSDGAGQVTVNVPPADHARTVVLSWRRDPMAPAPIPAPPAVDQTVSVQAGTASFLDLARGEERGFTLTVPDGGLYRVETLGRLHTSGRLATPFIANLGDANGNGVGQNMLIQSVLRAGRYRVDVKVRDGSGHLGLLASVAPLTTGAALLPGGSVRASLLAGTGVAFPVEVGSQAERYRLNVDGLGSAWTGRLEDNEGWPVTVPGELDGIEQRLRPGHYRLVIAPDVVGRKVVVRLIPLVKPADIVGHGPHDLPFGTRVTATWREPDGRDQPRAPDVWRFSLAGAAQAALRLGDGMVAELHRSDGGGTPVRIVGNYKGRLDAGAYVLDATSLGRNDRLGYSVKLDTEELQPDVPRDVKLPGDVPFAIAQARVVSLTTFGTTPVRAELRRADGTVVGRYGAREDDWNVAVSRLLPAGSYRLKLWAATPPSGSDVDAPNLPSYAGQAARQTDPSSDDSSSADNSNGDNKDASMDDNKDASNDDNKDAPNDDSDSTPPPPAADRQQQQTAATQGAADAKPRAEPDSNSDSDDDSDKRPTVSLHMALPGALPEQAAPASAAALEGQGVHVLTLPQPEANSLLVAQAVSPASLVLALERQDKSGWQTVAIGEGRAPVVAAPSDAEARPWRVEVWTVDGGPEPIRLAARAVEAASQPMGPVALAAVDGMPGGLAVARVDAGSVTPLRLADWPEGLLAGGWGGHALEAVDGDTLLLPGQVAWLLAPSAAKVTVERRDLPVNQPVTLSLQAGLMAPLPAVKAADGHVLLWRADSGLGQPGLGADMGVASASSLAMGQDRIVLRSAADEDALRLRLTRLEPALAAAMALTEPLHTVLAPGAALPVTVPAGNKRVTFDLAPGTAGIAGWKAAHADIAWAGTAPLTRGMAGAWTDILLVNTGSAPAPVSVSWQAEAPSDALHPGDLQKRFYGAAGSFEVPLNASAGARLAVAGHADLTVIAADGSVRRGRSVTLDGPGRAIVRHGVGAIALWMETDDRSPWPAVVAQAVTAPAHLVLTGPAMALTLTQDRPMLLHATTSAPVLIGLKQAGRTDAPALFPAGASFHRVVAAGAAELRIYAPQDGPLTGSMDLAAEPILPIQEGLGQAVNVSPGGTAVFGFGLVKAATIGVGVRADPDRAVVRLLDAAGKVLGEGVAQLRSLPAGQYLVEAQVAPDAPPTTLRPAVVGITPRGSGPPPDVAAGYLALVGMKLQEGKK